MEFMQGKIDCQPEETGYDSTRLPVLNRHLERLMNEEIIRGAIYCICHKGKVIAHGGLGEASYIKGEKLMKADTIFPAASITKVFTAVAIMQLVEDGLLNLITPVSEILPQFSTPPFHEITIRHLLTHTSGLYPDGGCFQEAAPKVSWQLIEEAAERFKSSAGEEFDWISPGISSGLRRATGTQWQYCSFGFSLLGEIITRLTGTFAHDYIEEKILKILDMKDSRIDLTAELAKRSFIRNEYHRNELDKIIQGKEDNEFNPWEKIPETGGGLYSTVYDLSRFGNAMLYNGRLDGARILGRKSVEKMTTIQFEGIPDYCWNAKEPNRLYGIGFDMRQGPAYSYSPGTFMHEGSGACSLVIDPAEQLTAAWFVPFNGDIWSLKPLYNVQNVIWSGIL